MIRPCSDNKQERYHCALCGAAIPTAPGSPRFDAPCPTCGYPRWCRVRTTGDRLVIETLPDRVPDEYDVKRLSASLLDRDDIARVALDMSSLDTISSLFLARMITLNRGVEMRKGKLLLCGLSPVVREILHRTHTDSLFEINRC